MINLNKNLKDIYHRFKSAEDVALLLDFDGTLSPIVLTPEIAFLPESTKHILSELKKHFYIAIISGRELSDIKRKVGLPGLIYAGNHGFEWQIGEEKKAIKIPLAIKKALADARKNFDGLPSKYPGLLLYDKRFSFTVHYRKLSKKPQKIFIKEAEKIVNLVEKTGLLSFVEGKKDFEIRPKIKWDKGEFAKFLLDYLREKNKKNFVPVYMGDSATDEDVFRELKTGITIRVGYRKGSYAKYFIKNQKEVDRILALFLSLAENRKSVKIIYSH